MDSKSKTCNGEKLLPQSCNANANTNADVDRFSSLPDEVLGEILSWLPTEYAVAALILSKRMRKVFSWISCFHLDASSKSHCIKHPQLVERFLNFESFVDNLLTRFSPRNTPLLTHFRLTFGENTDPFIDSNKNWRHGNRDYDWFPDVLPERLNMWISYPIALARCGGGLKVLELSFFLRRPWQFELPPSLFTCQSLEVFTLESNLVIDDARIPMINLPNLKYIDLRLLVFDDDNFVTRLVSSCSVLEDLHVRECWWMIGDRLSISSHSLRSLAFSLCKYYKDRRESFNLWLIDTPNLQKLHCIDDVATRYSFTPMTALVKANVCVYGHELSFETEFALVAALSHVPELSLGGSSVAHLYYRGELREQLPVFRNLKTLKLSGYDNKRRDLVLLLILHRTPSLETLVFTENFSWGMHAHDIYNDHLPNSEVTALQAEGWRSADVIPSCCLTRLKRVVFKSCPCSERELEMIKFLLAKSLVLEELVLHLSSSFVLPKLDQFENLVRELPMASNSCLITVQQ